MARRSQKNERAGTAASERISDELRQKMRAAIARHSGSEVLFIARLDGEARVASLEDVAHGNAGMVPVPRKAVEPGDVLIHNHPSGLLVPSQADIHLAAQMADEGIGSWIVDNEVERLYVIVESTEEAPLVPIDGAELAGILEPGGSLSLLFPDYQARPNQVKMLVQIAESFNRDLISAVEAGTGIGKTFAYLLPAARWALENKERVVVSTATINLQQQIIEKDIPLVAKLLRQPIKAVLAKGRGNYLCLKRLGEALEEDSLLREEDSDLDKIAEWARQSADGSKSDLSFIPPESLWSRINADADSCSGLSCPKREDCFFFKSRREASSANIVVANHHLLFADAAMRGQGLGFESTVVLPPFKRLIFDEAHNIENNATDFFSQTLNKWTLHKYLNLLLRKKRGRSFGVLALLCLGLDPADPLALEAFEHLLFSARDAMRVCDEEGLALCSQEGAFRLLPVYEDLLSRLMEALRKLHSSLLTLTEKLQDLLVRNDEETIKETPGLSDLQILCKRLSALASSCEAFRNYKSEEGKVVWIERERSLAGEVYAHFVACPTDIAPLLRESIYRPYKTVVLTSATLTVGGSFDWWTKRVGLAAKREAKKTVQESFLLGGDEWSGYDSGWQGFDSLESEKPAAGSGDDFGPTEDANSRDEGAGPAVLDRTPVKLRLDSPFDYKNRVLFGVPQDAPETNSPDYLDYLKDFVRRVLVISEGKGLVLFTSYDSLMKVYEDLKPKLEAEGLPVFRQGELERSKLLKKFNQEFSSSLFATESFWEGVDSPGQTLQTVILCKLPFKVPTEPLQIARSEYIQAHGGNPFMELSVPEAVMKFRQGFGRLMRRSGDYGAVLVPDKRLIAKPYGRIFLQSLPETRRIFAPTESLLDSFENFLGSFSKDKT